MPHDFFASSGLSSSFLFALAGRWGEGEEEGREGGKRESEREKKARVKVRDTQHLHLFSKCRGNWRSARRKITKVHPRS